MHAIVFGPTANTDRLISDLAIALGMATIELTADTVADAATCARHLAAGNGASGFLLRAREMDVAGARVLETALASLGQALDLALQLDLAQTGLAARLTATETPDLEAFYRDRGLLRRVRCEADPPDILRAAERIIQDVERARHPGQPADLVPVPALAPAGQDDRPAGDPGPAVSEPEPIPPRPQGGGWRQAALSKGRLKRGKGGWKPTS